MSGKFGLLNSINNDVITLFVENLIKKVAQQSYLVVTQTKRERKMQLSSEKSNKRRFQKH